MVEAPANCAICGTVTTHRTDAAGKLHCIRCILDTSLPPTSDVTPIATEAVPMPTEEPKRRSKAEIIAAAVTVAILGFLVYAFVRGA